MKILDAFLELPRAQKRAISVASDITLLLFAIWASYALRLEDVTWLPNRGQLAASVLTVLVTVAVFVKLGLYRAVIRYLGDKAFITILYGVAVSALALIVFGFLFQVLVPRSVPVIYGAFAFVFVSGTRLGIRMLVNHPFERNKESVAIVGIGETAMQLASALRQGTEYRPAFFIALDKASHKTTINGLPVISIELIAKNIQKYSIERILLALDPDSKVDRKLLLEELEKASVPVQTVPSVSELVSGRARINDIRDLEIEDLLGL